MLKRCIGRAFLHCKKHRHDATFIRQVHSIFSSEIERIFIKSSDFKTIMYADALILVKFV